MPLGESIESHLSISLAAVTLTVHGMNHNSIAAPTKIARKRFEKYTIDKFSWSRDCLNWFVLIGMQSQHIYQQLQVYLHDETAAFQIHLGIYQPVTQ